MKKLFSLWVLVLLLTLFIGAPCPGADGAKNKELVFYFDASYPVKWVSKPAAMGLRDFAESLGVKVLDARDLAAWMREKINSGAPGSLVFFASDVAPDTVVDQDMSPTALIRKYLDAGGGILWIGDVPLYWVGKNDRDMIKWDYLGSRVVLGFDTVGDWATKAVGVPTDLGRSLGLDQNWLSERALPPATVDMVLAVNEKGNAAGWIKKFSSDPNAVGLVRIWDSSLAGIDEAREGQVFMLLSRLGFIQSSGSLEARLTVLDEDEHWSVFHFDGGQLTRELAVKILNPQGEKNFFQLRVIVDGKQAGGLIPVIESSGAYLKKFVMVPLYRKDETVELLAGTGSELAVIGSVALDEKSFMAQVSPRPDIKPGLKIQPVDFGRVLIPANMVLLPDIDSFLTDISVAWLEPEAAELKIKIISTEDGKEIFSTSMALEPGKTLSRVLGPIKAPRTAGNIPIRVTGQVGDREVLSRDFTLILARALPGAKKFGATYADIGYDGLVWNYDRDTKEWWSRTWAQVWRRSAPDDVVVSFKNGQRFLFWKGSGYVPFWASDRNVGLTYEWVEAAWGRNGLNDCVEVLQDKDTRYSRVKILSSTPARAVVAWRYALNDLDYKICDDEWAEETFIFYPDGFGTRTVTAWIVPDTWHEANEFIVFLPPGINPFEVFPKRVITMLSPDGGKRMDVSYPKPEPEWEKGDPFVLRLFWSRDDTFTPIMAARKFDHFIMAYDGWSVGGRYISPSYWGTHYPVTRGWPTTVEPPPMWRETPSHASFLTIESEPLERKPLEKTRESVRWTWLVGSTDMDDKSLLELADTWIDPPALKLEGGEEVNFDPTQRAWVIEAGAMSGKSAALSLNSGRIVNPAFVLDGLEAGNLKVLVNGRELGAPMCAVGVERDFASSRTVVFIEKSFSGPVKISFKW